MTDEKNINANNSNEQIPNAETENRNEDSSLSKDEITSDNKSQSIEQEPEIMEVHTPHHIMHKKNWKEYFLEFLMIFLAVTLGFIAENVREHYIEHKRANQYAALLIQDIKKNTAEAKLEFERRKTMQASFDTLKNIIQNNEFDSNYKIVKHVVLLSETLPLSLTTATFVQMQNSGALRYIQDPELISLLTDYFNTIIPITQTDIQQEFQINANNNQKFIQQHFNLLQVDTSDNVLTAHPDIYDWNKTTSIQMFNIAANTSTWNVWIMNNDLLSIQEKGDNIIKVLKKDYNIK